MNLSPEIGSQKKLELFSLKRKEFKERIAAINKVEKMYKSTFNSEKIPLSLTFNDVLMIPQYGEV